MTRRLSLTADGRNMLVHLHAGDLPAAVRFDGPLAIDCEAMGLSLVRDRLTLMQLSDGISDIHLVQFGPGYDCPTLKAHLTAPDQLKLFHFGRFDLAMIERSLGVVCRPVYCTKIASKLARTYTDRHGLKDVVKEIIGKELSKEAQSSDWGAAELTDAQLSYAAADVLYLHQLKARLDEMLTREGRMALAQACFDFLPTRASLDLAGWDEIDIFAHS